MIIRKRGGVYVVEGDPMELDKLVDLELTLEVKGGKVRPKSVSAQYRRLLYLQWMHNPVLQELFEDFDEYYLAEFSVIIHEQLENINDLRFNGINLHGQDDNCRNDIQGNWLQDG